MKLIELSLRYRWTSVLICLLTMAVMAMGIKGLSLTNDYHIYFGESNPQLQEYETLLDTYSKNDNVLIAVGAKEGTVFTRETLSVIEALTRDAWRVPYSRRIDSLTNMQYTFVEGDDLQVRDLVLDAEKMSTEALAEVKDIALKDPLLAGALVSANGRVTGINVILQMPGRDSIGEIPEAVGYIRNLVAGYEEKYPQLEFHLAGQSMLAMAFPETSRADMKSLYPMMLLLILAMLTLLLRSVVASLLTFIVISFSALAGMGFFGWFEPQLAPIATCIPVMILSLAIANCVHITVAFFQNLRSYGGDKRQAMDESLKINVKPILLANVTTAIGFLTLNASDSPPFQLLGNMVAMGVMVSALLALFFYPPLLLTFTRYRAFAASATDDSSTGSWRWIEKLSGYVIGNFRILVISTLIISVITLALSTKNQLNETTLNYFDIRTTFRQDTDWVNENLTGVMYTHFSVGSASADSIVDPEYLVHLDRFTGWLRSQPDVRSVRSFTDIIKRLNQNMHGNDLDFYRIPQDRTQASQYLLLYELSLPFGLDLRSMVNIDKSATKVSANLRKMSAKELLAFENQVNEWMRENLPQYMWTSATSSNIVFAHINKRNVDSLMGGIALGVLIISIILMASLRSITLGIVSFVVNALPFFIAFGIWGAAVGEIGLGVSVVVGMALGIVVDDTVHFLLKYKQSLGDGVDAEGAVSTVFRKVGRAMIITTVCLVCGFMVLSGSYLSLNVEMGIMTALTIGIALAVDLLFLPALLIWLEKRRRPEYKAQLAPLSS